MSVTDEEMLHNYLFTKSISSIRYVFIRTLLSCLIKHLIKKLHLDKKM